MPRPKIVALMFWRGLSGDAAQATRRLRLSWLKGTDDMPMLCRQLFRAWILMLLVFPMAAAVAQQKGAQLKKEELHQLLAPIALYPDKLVAQVLMASTYPLEIVQAARWQKENAKLSGTALDAALDKKDWDPSVKSLVPMPQVLHILNDKLEWTQKLGDTYLAQPAVVLSEIQFLRKKAVEAGSLKTNKQQKVTMSGTYIVIEPASPTIVYVPVYNPTVVYGAWWYPAYPPYYYPPPTGAVFVSGFVWGAAIAVSAHHWGWGSCNWHGGSIHVNIDHYNRVNINGTKITSNNWVHNPVHRGPVPYRDAKSREQFGQKPGARPSTREARGFDAKPADRSLPTDRPSERPRAATRDAPGGVGNASIRRGPADGGRPSAFDLDRGANARVMSDRGRDSLNSARRIGGGGGQTPVGGGGRGMDKGRGEFRR
jgi:hypothetical protein